MKQYPNHFVSEMPTIAFTPDHGIELVGREYARGSIILDHFWDHVGLVLLLAEENDDGENPFAAVRIDISAPDVRTDLWYGNNLHWTYRKWREMFDEAS